MDQAYHTTASPTVAAPAFNPYLPAIGRVLEVLAALAPLGTAIETCNRDLAAAVGLRSAGTIPGVLRTLEADGYIERVTTPRGSLIVVLNRSGMRDRIQTRSRMPDRSQAPATAIPNETPDRSPDAGDERSAMADPPLHPPIRYQHASDSAQQLGARAPLFQALIDAGAEAPVARRILDRNPALTVAEFEALRAAARRRGSAQSPDSIGLVFWCLQHNQPLHTPKEPTYEPRRPAAPSRPRRPAPPADAHPPALTREYLQSRPRRGDAGRLPVPGGGAAAGDGGAGGG